jgi:aminoglycoside phosphotransferase
VWIHGDLMPGNLLTLDGRLSAVIDFGCLGIGERGRGWALSIALIQLPYYHETNPLLAAGARHTIAAVLAETSPP